MEVCSPGTDALLVGYQDSTVYGNKQSIRARFLTSHKHCMHAGCALTHDSHQFVYTAQAFSAATKLEK